MTTDAPVHVLESTGAICLWIAVIVRCPYAVRHPPQRGLWLAVATAALAMTLPLLSGLPGTPAPALLLARSLAGMVSAGAVLCFVVTIMGGRRIRAWACGAVAAVALALALLGLTTAAHRSYGTVATMPPAATAYWLLLICTHLTVNAACVAVCWRYATGHRSGSALALGLRLFGIGTALAGLYWLRLFAGLFTASDALLGYQPLLMALHGILRAAAVLVPTAVALRQAARDIRTVWRLWPLWRELVDAVPHVALARARPRLTEILWPRASWKLLAYRKVVETRDAILVLRDYTEPRVTRAARATVAAAPVRGPAAAEAAVLACVLREARHAKLTGLPRTAAHPPEPLGLGLGNGGLDDERIFLLRLAEAYASPPALTFAPHRALPRDDHRACA
ncbi:MAB_1171c family putative transporter [Streptomyces sp. NPDC046261]|uniref:MAB_1171c family putative transporter n=1 Tax=Streptomyces sp. NPDC046261 TaxID=3157200 RepID=UPI0033E51150